MTIKLILILQPKNILHKNIYHQLCYITKIKISYLYTKNTYEY